MLLDIFMNIENINTRLLNKKGNVYFKVKNQIKSIAVKPVDVIYAKTAVLEEFNFIEKPYSSFYLFCEENESAMVILHNKDPKRPWQIIYFNDEGSKPGDLYDSLLDVEFLSDKSCDFNLTCIPNGYHMEVYSIFDYDLMPKEDWLKSINLEHSSDDVPADNLSNILVGNFNTNAA